MNLKLELFNFKKSLTVDQLTESRIAQIHLENFEDHSEKELVFSLKENLKPYTYDATVKSFLESIDAEIESKPLVFNLKDLYKKLERKNMGALYRQPLVTLLEIINQDSDDTRLSMVLNELSIYDWIPEIKQFVYGLTNDPIKLQNMNNNGKASKVYTLVEKIKEGSLAFVVDRWFLINETDIKQVIADEYIKDQEKIREIRILEKIMEVGEIEDEILTIKVDEHLRMGVSLKDGGLYMNGEKLDKETTLEALFNSPVIPALKKDFYILCETAKANVDKFMELDIALKISNPLIPYLENIAFNYKDRIYLYTRDTRRGSSFFQYENALEAIRDVQKELDFDLTKFYENKVSKELKYLRTLEDKEKSIDMKLKDVNESIDMMSEHIDLIKEDAGLKETFDNLLIYKHNLQKEINEVRAEKIKTRKQIIG